MVIITAHGSIERAVEAMKAGAFDFIAKPFDPERLRVVVGKGMEREQLRRENAYLREEAESAFPTLIGESSKIRNVVEVAKRAADSSATVMITGPTGSGKEVLARNMHRWSPRRNRRFVVINCVALSSQLLESELFGHERGAFTGADRQRQGRFEAAAGGTVFLDEIGATRTDFQLKLLRVLQEGTFERVGGEQELRTDVRIIAATSRDLEEAVSAETFLRDLYYRLNVVTIQMPPLVEHREDIPLLARFFIDRYARQARRKVTGISPVALQCLAAYDWPGGVRELENSIERAVVLGTEPEIGADDLPEAVISTAQVRRAEAKDGYHASVAEYKRQLIEQALAETEGHQSKAAQMLGLQRSYLSRLMKNLGLR